MKVVQAKLLPIRATSRAVEESKRVLREAHEYRRHLNRDARARAKSYLLSRRELGARIVAERNSEVRAAVEIARAQGYEEGLIASKRDCLEIALKVASEVIGAEVASRPETLGLRIERYLSQHHLREGQKLKVNPEQVEIIAAQEIVSSEQIVGSEAVEPSSAVLQDSQSTVSLEWRDHLESVASQLRARLEAEVSSSYSEEISC